VTNRIERLHDPGARRQAGYHFARPLAAQVGQHESGTVLDERIGGVNEDTAVPLPAELPQRAEPVLHVVCLRDLAIPDGLNIFGQYSEALAGVGDSKELACGRAGYFTPDNHAVASHEHFLYVELHVGDRLGEVTDHFDRRIATPAFARKISRARLVIRRQDLLLDRFYVASGGHVEEAV